MLWESNGRPEGGDFSSQARKELESQLRAGLSLEEVERSLTEVTPYSYLSLPSSIFTVHILATTCRGVSFWIFLPNPQ